MKILTILCLLFFSKNLTAQVTADPAIGQMNLSGIDDSSVNANTLGINTAFRLRLPVYNLNQFTAIPPGTLLLKIDLGTKLVLSPSFQLNTAPLSNYFAWTTAATNGHIIITGNLATTLPADFDGMAIFDVVGNSTGTSSILANIQISNHNTISILTDEDLNNNSASLQYTMVPTAVPVIFTGVTAINSQCDITVFFYTEQELNVQRYEIEISKDGNNYVKAVAIIAGGLSRYKADFTLTEEQKSSTLMLRVKSIDRDGSFKLSSSITVVGNCDRTGMSVYPNPISNNEIRIYSVNGFTGGRSKFFIYTISGQLLLTGNINNTGNHYLIIDTHGFPAGNYNLLISNPHSGGKWLRF